MLAEIGEKVEASAAVMMIYFFCRFVKVEYCPCSRSRGVSSSDARRTSVSVCFLDPFAFFDMMIEIGKRFQPRMLRRKIGKELREGCLK